MSDTVESLLKRQKVLADFGDFAIKSEDLDEVLTEACRLVGEAMETGRSKVLEIEPGGESLFLRAGVGWDPGVVGHVHIPMGERSSESFAIDAAAPVITQDISKEERFDVPPFMKKAGVVALANVPIFLPGKRAYGLLQVDDTVPRDFDENDTEFLRTYATILGPVIDRLLKIQELRASEERFRLTVEGATDYAIFVTDAEDRITDWLPGAAAVYGWSAEEAVGQPSAILFTPEDQRAGQPEKEIETARRDGYAPNTRWHQRKDGSRVFIEGSVRALREGQGPSGGFLKIGQDVTEWRQADEQLRSSEERFRQIAQAIDQVFHIADPVAGKLLYVSPAYERVWGRSPEPLFEDLRAILDAIHPADRERVVAAQSRPTEARNEMEYRIIRPDGEVRWIRDRVFPALTPDNRPEWRVGVAEDITERRVAEEALRESEARFRLMADAVPQIVWITDHQGRTEFFNKQWTDYTGATYQPDTAAEVAARFVHPDDGAATVMAFNQAQATGGTFYVEHRIRSKAGNYRWFLVRGEPYRDPHTGEITRWFGASVDIHDRRVAEGKLRELNAALEQRVAERTAERNRVWEMSQDLFAIMGFDGTLKAINPAWTTTLGFDEATLLSLPFPEQVHPDDHAAVRELVERLRRGEAVAHFEDRLRHADRSWRWIAWSLVPEPGQDIFYAVGRDVTAEKAAAAEIEATQEALRQSQKMEAMGQLTGGVAHDFNNLLTPIVASLDILQRRGLGSEREQRLIAGAAQSADRAKTLVQRLLAFARRQPLQPVAVDVADLVRGMADLVSSTTGPQIRVAVEVGDDLPPAKADTNQLEMALLNLAVNARDAMPEGGTLRITAAAEEVQGPAAGSLKLKPGSYVRLSVADTGVGMDKATLARAVEPFFSTKGVGKGTGLGLSMVHGLASQLGGALSIHSRPGLGTNIELWLPRSTEQPDADAPSPERTTPQGRGTVLLVDDEAAVRLSTAELLGDLGYEVLEASSAEEALSVVRNGTSFDLVVTDHLMPGMTGSDLARAVRVLRPGVPILIISGYAESEGIEPDLPRLTKPFCRDELVASLAGLIG